MNLTGNDDAVVKCDGKVYRLNLAYTAVLTVFKVLADDGLTDAERVRLALLLLVKGDAPEGVMAKANLLEVIMTEQIDLKEHQLAAKLFKSHKKVFDFDKDAGRIAASFRQQYQIDLTNAEERNHISWAFFNALLDGLGQDTPFRQATAYRTMTIPDDADPDRKAYLQKMQTLYSLEKDTTTTIEQATAGMDRVQRIKYLAQQLKSKKKG